MKNILYFTADWCNPCKKVKPIVKELIKDGYFFQIIDADSELELVKTFEIRSIPTFILLKDGVEIKRITGAQTKIELINFINFVM
jgi:thioredoxin-like negative regulator of GroEL